MGIFVTILELLIRIVEMVWGSTFQSLYHCIFISEILGQIYGLAVDNFAIFLQYYCLWYGYRKRLFNMINELPTVFDVVTGKKPVKEKPVVNNTAGNKTKATGKVVSHTGCVVVYILIWKLLLSS